MSASAFGMSFALAGIGFSGAAFAHAHLRSETPATGSVVPSPSELRLKFSEGLELRFTTVKLSDSVNAKVETGSLSLGPSDNTVLIVPLPEALAPGRYRVDWHATSTDTHKTQGSYTFTVKP
jgi:methionine-rich copper-binding protein CopC